jgi:hypothetical protein
MYGFTLKIFYLILYSEHCQTIVGSEIYYFLYLAIFGISTEESYYNPEWLFRFVESVEWLFGLVKMLVFL